MFYLLAANAGRRQSAPAVVVRLKYTKIAADRRIRCPIINIYCTCRCGASGSVAPRAVRFAAIFHPCLACRGRPVRHQSSPIAPSRPCGILRLWRGSEEPRGAAPAAEAQGRCVTDACARPCRMGRFALPYAPFRPAGWAVSVSQTAVRGRLPGIGRLSGWPRRWPRSRGHSRARRPPAAA